MGYATWQPWEAAKPSKYVPLSSRTETFEGVIPIKKIYLEFHVVE